MNTEKYKKHCVKYGHEFLPVTVYDYGDHLLHLKCANCETDKFLEGNDVLIEKL